MNYIDLTLWLFGATLFHIYNFIITNIPLIFDTANSPIIVAITTILLGRFFILDKILPQKEVDFKIEAFEIISNIRANYGELSDILIGLQETYIIIWGSESKNFVEEKRDNAFHKEFKFAIDKLNQISKVINEKKDIISNKLISYYPEDKKIFQALQEYLKATGELTYLAWVKSMQHTNSRRFVEKDKNDIKKIVEKIYIEEKNLIQLISSTKSLHGKIRW